MKTKPGAEVTYLQQSIGSSNYIKEFSDHKGQLLAFRLSSGRQVLQSTRSGIMSDGTHDGTRDGDRGLSWACGTCTFANNAVTNICAMCYEVRVGMKKKD